MARALGGSESRQIRADSPVPADRLLLTAREVRRLLGVSPSTLERMIGRGELPVVRADRLRRFSRESVERWIRDHETGGGANG